VVAVAGDAVETKKGVLYLNDKPRYAKAMHNTALHLLLLIIIREMLWK